MMNKIEVWHQKQEHGTIIKAITAMSTQEQTPALRSLLARAYLNDDQAAQSLEILEGTLEADQDGLYCLRRGLTLFISHREHEAVDWFEKAKKLGVKEFDELPGTYYPKTMAEWLKRAQTRGPRRVEKVDFETERRAQRNKQPRADADFPPTVLDGLWDNCDYSLKEYVGKAATAEDFTKAEQLLGYRLPDAYKALMQLQNGGMLLKNIFENPLQRDWTPETFSAESIYGVDSEKPYSLCGEMGSQFMIEEWGYPDIGVAICDTMSGGHNMIFLDYTDCGSNGEPCVVEINQESDYEITYLADSFYDFVCGLFENQDEDED